MCRITTGGAREADIERKQQTKHPIYQRLAIYYINIMIGHILKDGLSR